MGPGRPKIGKKNGPKCSKMARKAVLWSQWIQTLQITLENVITGVGAYKMTCLNPGRGWVPSERVLGGPKSAKIGPKCSKMARKAVSWVPMDQISSNCVENCFNWCGGNSMTCWNPWQGLGALPKDPGGPKIGKKGHKKEFYGFRWSKQFKLPGKKLTQVWEHPAWPLSTHCTIG